MPLPWLRNTPLPLKWSQHLHGLLKRLKPVFLYAIQSMYQVGFHVRALGGLEIHTNIKNLKIQFQKYRGDVKTH